MNGAAERTGLGSEGAVPKSEHLQSASQEV